MRFAYADPPYLGCCGLYDHEHHGGGCWDNPNTHGELLSLLDTFDGWVLHLSTPSLPTILRLLDERGIGGRVMAWVKPFAAFKRNVSVAYAWEPVIVCEVRKPVVRGIETMRDFIDESITLRRGFTGAKPERVCRWAFEVAGLQPDDEFHDLFPGSGAVSLAHKRWSEDVLFNEGRPSDDETRLAFTPGGLSRERHA